MSNVAPKDEVEEMQHVARNAYLRGESAAALALLKRAWCRHPHSFGIIAMAAVAASDVAETDLSRRLFLLALRLDPSSVLTRLNFSSLLLRGQYVNEAVLETARVIAFEPDQDKAYINRAIALCADDRSAEAPLAYKRAIVLAPMQNPEAETSLGQLLLAARNYHQGWALYAARFRAGTPDIASTLPAYRPATGCRRLLLWGDQGLGDQIMFGSMTSDLQSRGQPFALQIDDRLVGLFKRGHPGVEVFGLSKVSAEGAFDARLALGDLGGILRDSDSSFTRQPQRYLVTAPDLAARWRTRLKRLDNLPVVGVSWRSANTDTGVQRSLSPARLVQLMAMLEARFINLQYGLVAEDLAFCRRNGVDEGIFLSLDDLDKTQNIEELAAVIDACDLIITIANTTAHLAAALGKPTWVLLPRHGSWRWMLEGTQTPWYPSVRLYRQPRAGDWSNVMAEIEADFRQLRPRLR